MSEKETMKIGGRRFVEVKETSKKKVATAKAEAIRKKGNCARVLRDGREYIVLKGPKLKK